MRDRTTSFCCSAYNGIMGYVMGAASVNTTCSIYLSVVMRKCCRSGALRLPQLNPPSVMMLPLLP